MKSKSAVATIVCFILLSSLLLSGCGGSSTAPAKAPTSSPAVSASVSKTIEPCELVSKADAQQYLGQPLKDPEKKETAAVGLKLCVYNTVQEGSGKLLQIGITQQSFMPNNGQTPQKLYAALKGNFPNALKVDGIGNDAFIAPPGLHILAGNYYLTVAVGNSNDPKNLELLKAIGKIIVAKL